MSYAKYLLSLQEGCNEDKDNVEVEEGCESCNEPEVEEDDFPVDESGFDGFGVDKMKAPEGEGLDTATSAADQFAVASDGKDTDVDLSFHASFPKDNSGFEKDANTEIATEEEKVDPNTVPAVPEEKDQFSDPNEVENVPEDAVSPAELAKDDDDIPVEESATGWDDLF